MKCQIPQISWHSRDPVLSVDFQPTQGDFHRLASGGTDSHVLIWYITYQENKSIKIECASDLYRHNKSVNVVRFSPNGELLASGDDEGAMFVWQLKDRSQEEASKDEEDINKEEWYPVKLLRGHLEDIYDISWSADGHFLVTASMDNTAIIWDMQKYQKLHILSDSKGYVQGVAWDPRDVYIASVGSDRALRFHNIKTKKTVYKVFKAPWNIVTEKGTTLSRLFYDDTLQSYCRRLCFTPDGELVIVPSGIVEKGEKFHNTTYIFSRHAPNKPVIHLPTGDKYTIAVRCNPLLYKLNSDKKENNNKENETDINSNKKTEINETPKKMIDLPYRMIFAVAASDSILLYDTEQLFPFAYISNIHYTHLSDLTWSSDGRILVVSSTDGYCSFIIFSEDELGEVYEPETVQIPEPVKIEETLLEPLTQSNKVDICNSPKIDNIPINLEKEKEVSKVIQASEVEKLPDKSNKAQSPSSNKRPVEDSKSNKKPKKVCSIKNYFISPKEMAEKASSPAVKIPEKVSDEIIVSSPYNLKPSSAEKESISTAPEKQIFESRKDNSPNNLTTGKADCKDVPETCANVSEFTPKRILTELNKQDDSSVEIIFDGKTQAEQHSSSTKPKCKVQLNFANAKNPVKKNVGNVDHDITADAVLSFSDCKTDENISEVIPESELPKDVGDWKLELSQDDEPMEETAAVSTSEADEKVKRRVPFITLSDDKAAGNSKLKSSEIVKKVHKVPSVVMQLTDKLADNVVKTSDTNEQILQKSHSVSNTKAKRRIPFVTISPKASFKPLKE